ncbi:MAG: permease, partial [Plesiomonas sp.]
IAITQSATLFGWFIALAVIWTKYMGEIMVSSNIAAMMVAGFAFIITLFIEYRTKQSLIIKKVSIFE